MGKKKKFKSKLGVIDVYNFYKKNYSNELSQTDVSKILNEFNQSLIEAIYRGAYVTLPYKLGELYIYKYKPKLKFDENGNLIVKNKFKMIDYKATNALWEEFPEFKNKKWVYYTNFHTDGYRFRIEWRRYHLSKYNKLYNFTPSRNFSRGLAAYLRKNPNQSYYDK